MADGMLAPPGAPKPIVERMHAELGKIVSSPDFKSRLVALGTDETPVMSAADLSAWLRNETERWRRTLRLRPTCGFRSRVKTGRCAMRCPLPA